MELNGSNTYSLNTHDTYRNDISRCLSSSVSLGSPCDVYDGNNHSVWCVIKPLKVGISPEFIGVAIQVSCTSIAGAYFVALVQERLAREAFLANYLLDIERAKSERLLANVLPETIAHRLKDEPTTIADRFESATVLFADIVDFTQLAAKLSSEELVSLLNQIFSAFDALAEKHGLEKIKTIGDAYMAVAGVPEPDDNHAQAAARMALELRTAIAGFKRESGEPLQPAHWPALGAGDRGSDWDEEVYLRSLGRHGQYGQPHGVSRHPGSDSGHRDDLRPTREPSLSLVLHVPD